jgi:hypothetical protein
MRGFGTTRRMCVRLLILSAASVLVALSAGPSASAQAPRGKCSASAKLVKAPGRFNIDYRFSCNFLVERITFAASKEIKRISRTPSLTVAEEGEDGALTCEKTKAQRARCLGHAHEDTVIKGSLRVRRPCRKPKLSLDLKFVGGEDNHHGPSLLRPVSATRSVAIKGC